MTRWRRGGITRGESNLASTRQLHTVWNPQRGSQCYIEKRGGRKEIKVTGRRKGGIKRRETNLASNQFSKCSPQPGTPTEIDRVGLRREGGGRR